MANQITIDPTEVSEGEFTADELDSISVGEQLFQEEQALLAGMRKRKYLLVLASSNVPLKSSLLTTVSYLKRR